MIIVGRYKRNVQLTKSLITSLVIRSSGLLLGFALSIVVSNYLGAAALGLYALFVVHLNIAVIFGKVGMDTLLLREGANATMDSRRVLFGTALKKSLLPTFLTVIAFSALLFGLQKEVYSPLNSNYLLPAFTLALIGLVIHRLALSYYRAGARTELANTYDGVLPNVFVMLGLGALMFIAADSEHAIGFPIFLFTAFYILFGCLALIFLLPKRGYGNQGSTESTLSYKASLPFLLIGAITTINTSVDSLSVSALMTAKDLGLYNVSLKISALISFPLVVAASVVSNQFARLHSQGNMKALYKLYWRVTLAVGGLALIGVIIFGFIGEWLLAVWGDEFVAAYSYTLILCIGQVVNACFGPLGVLLSMTRREKVVLYVSLVGIVVNVILNYVLIRTYGLTGAAVATAIAIVLQNIGFWLGYKLSGKNNDHDSAQLV